MTSVVRLGPQDCRTFLSSIIHHPPQTAAVDTHDVDAGWNETLKISPTSSEPPLYVSMSASEIAAG